MRTTYGMDTCIETNEIVAFGMEVYSRYIPGICKNMEDVRHIPDICLRYDTLRIPDVRAYPARGQYEWAPNPFPKPIENVALSAK